MNTSITVTKSNKRKIDTLITDFFKPIVNITEHNLDTYYLNPCPMCGINMGDSTRQLCGKWRCYYII